MRRRGFRGAALGAVAVSAAVVASGCGVTRTSDHVVNGKQLFVAKGGRLLMPADAGGALAYRYASATAAAGALTVDSPNASSTPHDIAVQGPGVNEVGKVVQNGGVSTVKVTLKPGKYQYFCTVDS